MDHILISITKHITLHPGEPTYLVTCLRCGLRWAVASNGAAVLQRTRHALRHLEVAGEVELEPGAASRHAAEDRLAAWTEATASPLRRAVWRLRTLLQV